MKLKLPTEDAAPRSTELPKEFKDELAGSTKMQKHLPFPESLQKRRQWEVE